MIPLVVVSLALTFIPVAYSANITAVHLPSIWETVNSIGPQSLVEGLKQSPQIDQIEDAFNQKNITLFLPSQTAVQDAITANVLNFQSNNTLQQLLRHISPGTHYASSLIRHQYLQSNDSSSAQLPLVVGPNLANSSLLQISSGMYTANIIKQDIHCGNGVIHIVDEFLRAPMPTLATVEGTPELEHHELLIKSLNLTDVVAGPNKTVLAPINDAWDIANSSAMPYGVLVHNLKYQVIDGIYLQNTLFSSTDPVSLPTNNRNFTITFHKTGNNELLVVGMTPIDVARVVRADVITTEGVIYIIDKVLPADPTSSRNSGDSGGQLAAGPLNPSETQVVSAADIDSPNSTAAAHAGASQNSHALKAFACTLVGIVLIQCL